MESGTLPEVAPSPAAGSKSEGGLKSPSRRLQAEAAVKGAKGAGKKGKKGADSGDSDDTPCEVTRLLSQPASITGEMRSYQLEGVSGAAQCMRPPSCARAAHCVSPLFPPLRATQAHAPINTLLLSLPPFFFFHRTAAELAHSASPEWRERHISG